MPPSEPRIQYPPPVGSRAELARSRVDVDLRQAAEGGRSAERIHACRRCPAPSSRLRRGDRRCRRPWCARLIGRRSEVRRVAEREDRPVGGDDPVAVGVLRGGDRDAGGSPDARGVAEIERATERSHVPVGRQHAVPDQAELRATGHAAADRAEPRVEVRAWAFGDAEVAVAGDVRERRRLPGEVRELIGGRHIDALLARLPREHAHRGGQRRVARRRLREVAEQDDAAAAGVVVQRVRADDAEPVGRLARVRSLRPRSRGPSALRRSGRLWSITKLYAMSAQSRPSMWNL